MAFRSSAIFRTRCCWLAQLRYDPDRRSTTVGKSGFTTEFHPSKKRLERDDARRADHGPLETNDNSEQDEDAEIAPPEQIEDNLHHYLSRMNHVAGMFKKHFKLSTIDREAETRIMQLFGPSLLCTQSVLHFALKSSPRIGPLF